MAQHGGKRTGAGSGGARPGAGRKPKSEKLLELRMIEAAYQEAAHPTVVVIPEPAPGEARISEDQALDRALAARYPLAREIVVAKLVRAYLKDQSTPVLPSKVGSFDQFVLCLMDREFGRAKQKAEITGSDGPPITLVLDM